MPELEGKPWRDIFYESFDDIRLYARHYPAPDERFRSVICLPGLTRNAREQVKSLNTMVLMRTPAGRWGVPNDLSGIAVFLASPAASFITGANLVVDGGITRRVQY